MDFNVAIIGIVVEIFVLIMSGVWCVGKISSTTAVLNETIKSLKHSVDDLRSTIYDIQKVQAIHQTKIAVLEAANHDKG